MRCYCGEVEVDLSPPTTGARVIAAKVTLGGGLKWERHGIQSCENRAVLKVEWNR